MVITQAGKEITFNKKDRFYTIFYTFTKYNIIEAKGVEIPSHILMH